MTSSIESKTSLFEDFFDLDSPEVTSPFVKKTSRYWGANLTIKAALLAAVFLLLAFLFSYFEKTTPLSNLLLVSVYFLAGIPALIESLEDLAEFDINIDILMTLAAFSSILIGSGLEGGLLLVLFALSGAMEDAVTEKAKSSISSLHKLSPTTASVIQEDGSLLERSVKEIPVGTIILVKAGQIVPLDGIVVDGISAVNLVHLTGENFPVTKKINDEVAAGATNLDGRLVLRVLKTSSDSTLSKIIQLVTEAHDARPKLQRWFDEFSRTYAISIICLSFVFAITFPFLLSIPFFGLEGSIYRALAFLIAASPCALIIAMPIAYLSSIGACASKGILLKGGVVLDALSHCKSVAFDKTGTLTTGDLSLSKTIAIDGKIDLRQALSIAYALEKNAIHPVAKAIIHTAKKENIAPASLKDFKAIAGSGLTAIASIANKDIPVAIGSVEYIASKTDQKTAQLLFEKVDPIKNKGLLVSAMLIGSDIVIYCFQDTIREEIKTTISHLKNDLNLHVYMLTGDHENSAKRVAEELQITSYHADLKPEDKLSYVTKIADKEGLAMVGDGINDAPALARATVGISMGKVGTTTAAEASDIVLLQDNIESLDWLFKKANLTQTIVKQNLTIAISAIFIATIPSLAGLIPLWLAVLLHEGGTVIVGLNGLRLLKK